MKKKMRDLTYKEMEKIYDNYFGKYKYCKGCILNLGYDRCFKYLDLDWEIEVESEVEAGE